MDEGKLAVIPFEVLKTDTVILTRPAGTTSVQANVKAPTGANLFIANGTLTNASPLLTFPLQYNAPDGVGGILWGVRAYYDASVGLIRIFLESFNAGVTPSMYVVAVKYYLINVPIK